jgi:hypothetical protein
MHPTALSDEQVLSLVGSAKPPCGMSCNILRATLQETFKVSCGGTKQQLWDQLREAADGLHAALPGASGLHLLAVIH